MSENSPPHTSETASRAQVGCGNVCLPETIAVFGGPAAYRQFLVAGGFDESVGYEWTPFKFEAAKTAAEALAAEGLITSMSESWRENTVSALALELGALCSINRANEPNRRDGLKQLIGHAAAIGAFPLLDKSYDSLDHIGSASQAGRQRRDQAPAMLPLIIHPAGQWLDGQTKELRPRETFPDDRSGEVWFQVTAEWVAAKGISPQGTNYQKVANNIFEAHSEQDIDGIVIDIHHLQADRSGLQFTDPIELAYELAKLSSFREVQPAFRPDFNGDPTDIDRAVSGRMADTPHGRILSAVSNGVPVGRTIRAVSESRASELRASIKRLAEQVTSSTLALPKNQSLPLTLVQAHYMLNYQVRDLLAA